MIDAQEAKCLQKIDDGLAKTFEIIEDGRIPGFEKDE